MSGRVGWVGKVTVTPSSRVVCFETLSSPVVPPSPEQPVRHSRHRARHRLDRAPGGGSNARARGTYSLGSGFFARPGRVARVQPRHPRTERGGAVRCAPAPTPWSSFHQTSDSPQTCCLSSCSSIEGRFGRMSCSNLTQRSPVPDGRLESRHDAQASAMSIPRLWPRPRPGSTRGRVDRFMLVEWLIGGMSGRTRSCWPAAEPLLDAAPAARV
jgi:hypothetical protein